MAFKRTVTCRWCYQQGHNSNGCPQKKNYVANNPNSWAAEQEQKRLENIKHRSCTYCKGEGHNRKSCETLKEDMRIKRINVLENRLNVCNIISEMGVAPGSLVRSEIWTNNGYDRPIFLITDIAWEDISTTTGADGLYVKAQHIKDGKAHYIHFPPDRVLRNEWREYTAMVSPVDKEFASRWNHSKMEQTNEAALKKVEEPKWKY